MGTRSKLGYATLIDGCTQQSRVVYEWVALLLERKALQIKQKETQKHIEEITQGQASDTGEVYTERYRIRHKGRRASSPPSSPRNRAETFRVSSRQQVAVQKASTFFELASINPLEEHTWMDWYRQGQHVSSTRCGQGASDLQSPRPSLTPDPFLDEESTSTPLQPPARRFGRLVILKGGRDAVESTAIEELLAREGIKAQTEVKHVAHRDIATALHTVYKQLQKPDWNTRDLDLSVLDSSRQTPAEIKHTFANMHDLQKAFGSLPETRVVWIYHPDRSLSNLPPFVLAIQSYVSDWSIEVGASAAKGPGPPKPKRFPVHPSSPVDSVEEESEDEESSMTPILNPPVQPSAPSRRTPARSSRGKLYEIEHLLSHRVDDTGRTLFFVKWKGYPTCDATWEPEENLPTNMVKTYRNIFAGDPSRFFTIISHACGSDSAIHYTLKWRHDGSTRIEPAQNVPKETLEFYHTLD